MPNNNVSGTGSTDRENSISYITSDGEFEIIEARIKTGMVTKPHETEKEPYTGVKIRVKNHSGVDIDEVEFSGYIYDTNGDKLNECYWRIYDLEADKQALSDNDPFAYCTEDDFGGIKLTGYTISKRESTSSYRRTADVLFDKKIDIEKKEMSIE